MIIDTIFSKDDFETEKEWEEYKEWLDRVKEYF